MEKRFLHEVVLVWLLLALLATANGVVRNAVYKPVVGDLAAHQISTLIFVAVVFCVTYLFLRREKLPAARELIQVGSIWTLGTVLFEFVFGHFVFGNPWEKLFADYDLRAGRIWLLVLLAIFSAPYLVGRYLEKNKN